MAKQFSALGISTSLQERLKELELIIPTDIQKRTIPLVLNSKKDVVALAKTGTGKTAAFALPLLQLIHTDSKNIQVVVLAPTRELGHQIYDNFVSFNGLDSNINIASICGGIPIKPQIEKLKGDVHIVIATPGRLVDLIKRKATTL